MCCQKQQQNENKFHKATSLVCILFLFVISELIIHLYLHKISVSFLCSISLQFSELITISLLLLRFCLHYNETILLWLYNIIFVFTIYCQAILLNMLYFFFSQGLYWCYIARFVDNIRHLILDLIPTLNAH